MTEPQNKLILEEIQIKNIPFNEARNIYPAQMNKIIEMISRTTWRIGKNKKAINEIPFPDDYIFFTTTMQNWTSINKTGIVETKSLVAKLKRYDTVFESEISKHNIL